MKNLITLILVLIFGCTLNGQQLNRADRLSKYYEYSETISILNKIIEKDYKGKDEAIVKLADTYRYMNIPDSSSKWYSEAVKLDSVEPINYYYYGQSLRNLGKYDEAKEQFLIYDSLTDDPRGKIYAQYCEDIKPYLISNYYSIYNVESLNSDRSDFTPVKYKNGVVLSSDRIVRKQDNIYEWTGNSYLSMYFSESDSIGNYGNLDLFSKQIENRYHDATPTFNSSGDMVYFTRTMQKKTLKDDDNMKTHKLMIFYSYLDGDKWSKPYPISLNNESYSVGHPFLVNDNILYFVSDMEGGYGGTDIYVSYLEDDCWSIPKNLGENINTFGNEMFPSVIDGKLYFSSDGHLGYGGLDVFVSEKVDNEWGYAENLMKPLNSSYDDFGVNGNMFSSNRPGGLGEDDIYSFNPISLTICGKVVGLDGKPILNATVFIYSPDFCMSKVHVLKTGIDGEYCIKVEQNVNYVIKATMTGFFDDCLKLETPVIVNNESVNVPDLRLIKFRMEMEYTVDDIYYDFDKWNIREDSKSSLDFVVDLMKEYDITIELGSHTDCRGTDEYNMILSQKRAESAVEYIVSKGIDSSRITAKGYGESNPINGCIDGVVCTKEQYQENRRTEFKVITVPMDPPVSIGDNYFNGDVINFVDFEDGFLDCDK